MACLFVTSQQTGGPFQMDQLLLLTLLYSIVKGTLLYLTLRQGQIHLESVYFLRGSCLP